MKTEDFYQKQILDLLENWHYGGTLRILQGGKTFFAKATGLADRENGIPNTMDTTFFIAGVTKTFTAAGILLLSERKLLRLTDHLDKYIPEYSHAKEMTVKQLLNNATGIPDFLEEVLGGKLREEKKTTALSPRDFFVHEQESLSFPLSLPTVLGMVNDLPLQFVPGKEVHLSNTNYYLLGIVVERIAEMPLGNFLKKQIFDPLGMKRTTTGPNNAGAVSYRSFEGETIRLGKPEGEGGHGGIVTTAEDLGLWLDAVLTGKLLAKDSWEQTFKMFKGETGFGWEKVGTWVGQSGQKWGFFSQVYVSFENGAAVAMLGNIPSPMRGRLENYTIQKNIRMVLEAAFTTPKAPRLVRLTDGNVRDCISLDVDKGQKSFVADNVVSLAQAYVNRSHARPFLIVEGSQAIGFVMFSIPPEKTAFYIWRFMIDQRFQGRGYGKAGMILALDHLRSLGAKKVTLSVETENGAAIGLYTSLGFRPTGEMDDDEMVMSVTF
jgi:D-alanyl-D-alanine carboxypeptidase